MNTKIIQFNDTLYTFDQGMVRSYLVIGQNKALLVDTGAFSFDIISAIREITSLPISLCLTHADRDHTKNITPFKEIHIYPDEITYLPNHDSDIIPIDDQYIFNLGNQQFHVIHTPGHTPGSICLYDQENHILFSGDTISYGPIYMFGHNRNLNQYLQSLLMLDNLFKNKDITIYPAHNTYPIFSNEIINLIQCVNGINNHTISGTTTNILSQDHYSPLLYQYNQCGIYK